MKTSTAGVTHHRALEIVGNLSDAGNGLALSAGASSAPSKVSAIGDDSNVGLALQAKVAGTLTDRFLANGAAKTIVDGSATALFNVAVAQGEVCGGFVDFLVRVKDGTDLQAIAGRAAYSAVNKAGTITSTVTYTTAPEAKAVSSGTLTLSFTAAENPADTLEVRVQPTGSLTETTYTIEYNVQPIRGAVTIL